MLVIPNDKSVVCSRKVSKETAVMANICHACTGGSCVCNNCKCKCISAAKAIYAYNADKE